MSPPLNVIVSLGSHIASLIIPLCPFFFASFLELPHSAIPPLANWSEFLTTQEHPSEVLTLMNIIASHFDPLRAPEGPPPFFMID